jgi:hypothetical protein
MPTWLLRTGTLASNVHYTLAYAIFRNSTSEAEHLPPEQSPHTTEIGSRCIQLETLLFLIANVWIAAQT